MALSTISPTATPAPVLRPTLSVIDAISIIVGLVIGAGIFETPSIIAASSPSQNFMLLAWVAGGAMTLIGALCYAELATAYPHPGGNYHYLMRAFGVGPAFLLGWGRLAVLQTGSIALLGYVFGDYASQIVRLGDHSSSLYAAIGVVILTFINFVGVRLGKWTQNSLTIATLLGLLAVVIVGLLGPDAASVAAPAANAAPEVPSISAAFGTVMIFVLLTYGGWSEAAYISAEVRNSRKNMVRVLMGSIAIITLAYVLVNLALARGLGIAGMAGTKAVSAELMRQSLGTAGAVFISALVAVAVFGSMNGTIITGARTNYAMGLDYKMFSILGRWRERGDTPGNALLVQGAIALGLVLLGAVTREGFRTMVEYTAPVFWLFLLLTGISLMVLRSREPDVPRPYKVPAYPFTPILFCLISGYMLYASLVYTGVGALVGAAVLLAGAPLLLFINSGRAVENHRGERIAANVEPEREAA